MATVTENKVIIAKGTLANYSAIEEKSASTLYFTTESEDSTRGSLYLGDILIGSNVTDITYSNSVLTISKYNPETGEDNPIVLSFADVASAATLTTAIERIATLEAVGAEANVQADWNEIDEDSDAFILNKPEIPEVSEWALAEEKPTYTASEVGAATTADITSAIEALDLETELAGKVDVDGDKVLSTNDYTTDEKNKLAGIEATAEVNVLESVVAAEGALIEVTEIDSDKVITISTEGVETYVATEIGKIEIPSVDGLASTTYVDTAIANLVDSAPETLDTLSEIATAIGETDDALEGLLTTVSGKQDALTAGANITIEVDEENGDALTISASTAADVTAAIADYSTRITAAEGDIDALETGKVDVVDGKGLSTNDYTTDEKTKLAGIAEGAEVNAVTSVGGLTGAITFAEGTSNVTIEESDTTITISVSETDLTGVESDIETLEGKVEALEEKDDALYWYTF